jgi:chemotaxis protein CheZ
MQKTTLLQAQYGSRVQALSEALQAGDEALFFGVLDDMLHTRKPAVFGELRELTTNLQMALDRFRVDSRLADLAEKDMPDARQRLAHVLKMTDEAAHSTMDLVEQSGPPAERAAKEAESLLQFWTHFRNRSISVKDFHDLLGRMDTFLPLVRADAELIRKNLAEVLLTQGYQDLTGQIIRGVMVDLTRLSGEHSEAQKAVRSSKGHGPVVPGVTQGEVASGQQDVDALLSGLGV